MCQFGDSNHCGGVLPGIRHHLPHNSNGDDEMKFPSFSSHNKMASDVQKTTSQKRRMKTISTSSPDQEQKDDIRLATANSAQHVRNPIQERPVVHRINTKGSVQAVVVDDDILIVGLEGGDLTAWSLYTYEQLACVHAHEQSVLGLQLSQDRRLLFSCGADSVVNVWSTLTFEHLYSIHSNYDIGDIFCVSYSSNTNTLFCGSQNSSIQVGFYSKNSLTISDASQWLQLDDDKAKSPVSTLTPSNSKHRFFDSLGPGGKVTVLPQPDNEGLHIQLKIGRQMYFPKTNYLQYAHKSYIYCMLLAKGLFRQDLEEEILVTGSGDGVIKLWKIDALQGLVQHHKFSNGNFSVLSLALGGSFLFAGLSDGAAHVYNLASDQLVHKLQVGSGDVTSIEVLDGMALCGTSLGEVKQFNAQFTEVDKWTSNHGKILATAIVTSPSRDIFLTAGNDNTVALWNVTDGVDSLNAVTPHGNDDLIQSLREFVSYHSVAANPKYVSDCHKAVGFLRKLFNLFHATTELLPAEYGINPTLLAKFNASNRDDSTRTVLFYGHYDVVDAEDSVDDQKWVADPFKLHPLNGYLYGRGVSDNKGPILAALYAVAELVQSGSLSCNIVFLLEGEEEAGSRSFKETVRANRNKVGNVDYVFLSNSYWLDDHIPCLTYGMRGVIHADVTVSSSKPDQHSGMDGKISQHEPLKDVMHLGAILSGPSARGVELPSFFQTVRKKQGNIWEEKEYDRIATTLMRGHSEITNKINFVNSLKERWQQPNLTVHCLGVPESKTAVTIPRSAVLSLSIRIVPFQTAGQVAQDLKEFIINEFHKLRSQNQLEITITSKADPWLGNPEKEPFCTLKRAIAEVWQPQPDAESPRVFPLQQPNASSPAMNTQKRSSHRRASSLATTGHFTLDNIPRSPLFIREGGSIPAIAFLEKEFHAAAAMFPMGQASDNAHLDNERMRIENLYKGRDVLKKVFSEL